MDAVKFLEIIDRLSRKGNNIEKMRYNEYREANDNAGAVRFVERWSKEHPRKTRQDVFLEQWPNAARDRGGVVNICPKLLDVDISCTDDETERTGLCKACDDCRREFLMQEVE